MENIIQIQYYQSPCGELIWGHIGKNFAYVIGR